MRFATLGLLYILWAIPALAAFSGGKPVNETSVQQIKNMQDDTYVTLTGNIVSQIGKDKYIFKDTSGEIRIEIDYEVFRGQNVTPQDTVRITGEVEKDFGQDAEVDVNTLEIIK